MMATAGGSALPVMTYADRVKEEKRSQMWAAVGAGFAAAANSMNAANAGYSSTYGNYSGTATVGGGKSYGFPLVAMPAPPQIRTEIFLGKNLRLYCGVFGAAASQRPEPFERQQANAEFSKRSLEARALSKHARQGKWCSVMCVLRYPRNKLTLC